MAGRTSLDRFQVHCEWERPDEILFLQNSVRKGKPVTSNLHLAAGLLLLTATCLGQGPTAPAKYRGAEPVAPAPDGTIFCEAEEFTVEKPGWRARPWGENYYAATFANTFLSRKAFLGAPENCDETVATIQVRVAKAGRYLVLVRYEAAYRFETQFRVKVEQAGRVRLDRLYGTRENLKVWAFGERLKKDMAWSWGAAENVVWEGHDAYAQLEPGPARITLTAGRQPSPRARRNVDLVMLTQDAAQVRQRIEKEGYLPLDGMLTQAGDVWVRLVNRPDGSAMTLTIPPGIEHSSYWVHMRQWKPVVLKAEPGRTVDWTEVGSVLDTLNDGQWNLQAATAEKNKPLHFKVEFGVRAAAGQIEKIAEFESREPNLRLTYQADTRYSRRIGTQEQVLYDLFAALKAVPMHGRVPVQTPIYCYTFDPGLSPRYDAARREFQAMFGLRLTSSELGPGSYVDWRGQSPEQLEATCKKLDEVQRQNIAVVSLGDEIGLPAPDAKAATEGFVTFLKTEGVTANQLDPGSGGDWTKIRFSPDPKMKETRPGLYYWSLRYQHEYGIQAIKRQTDVLRRWLPNAAIGANYSPQHGDAGRFYLGEVFQWVNCFREDGLTLPWAEDYIWGVPVGTQQMNGIDLDLFRAGLRGKPDRKILYYVMPHVPGNTPASWRRMFHNALGHGMKIVDLFEFRPVQVAYTENHVTGVDMYAMVLRTFRELGQYEDIVQAGQRRPAEAGLWFSETADIWDDYDGSFGAAKRALYIAILHQQLPLDFLVEQDALDGTLARYKVLYLADRHVGQAASAKIAAWVQAGGRLLATAGAGMLDEYNRPNRVLRDLLGVEIVSLVTPKNAEVGFIKQDLPFAGVIDKATWSGQPLPATGVVARMRVCRAAKVEGTFTDGSPAVVTRQVGKGETRCCGLLPGLVYFQPAIPLRPVDRGSTDDSMSHFIPTQFDEAAGRLIGSVAEGIARPVTCSEPLVEASLIESKAGAIIVLANWSGKPVKGLEVTFAAPLSGRGATLASGAKVQSKREPSQVVLTLDLDVADVLILR
jgi:hypothetical protein